MGTRQSVPSSTTAARREPAMNDSNGWSTLLSAAGPLHDDRGPGGARTGRSYSVPMPMPSLMGGSGAGPSSSGTGAVRDPRVPPEASDTESDPRALVLQQILGAGPGSSARPHHRRRLQSAGLPPMAFRFFDIKCPVCNKHIASDEAEVHLVMCLTRPRLTYNDDVLSEDKGECAICFEDMNQGDTIARLPCLCVYHKGFKLSLNQRFGPLLGNGLFPEAVHKY